MPKYLIQANYVGEGLKGLLKEGGSSRRAAVDKLLGSVGGRVEAFYYAFGDTDAFAIVDVPDVELRPVDRHALLQLRHDHGRE